MTGGEMTGGAVADSAVTDSAVTGGAGVLVLVGSGLREYREWILRSVARRYPLWLLAPGEVRWAAPHLVGQSTVDALDVPAAVDAVRALAATRPVLGLLCYDELRIWHTARIATALGLPTSTPDAVLACRDKALSRRLMTEAGVPGAVSVRVSGLDQALAAAERIGYPVVLKPRGLAGSEGVTRVDDPGELVERFGFTRAADFAEVPRYAEDVLVEEYLDGPEIAVDSVVRDGAVRPVFVSHKEFGLPPTFEETGHSVDADDPLLRDPDLLAVLAGAHAAIGFAHGVTHTELRLTRRGPRVVELNGRLGGDLIPYVGRLATGVDLALAAADLAAGRDPDLTPTTRRSAAVRFYYPDRDVVVQRVALAAPPPGVVELRPLAEPGRTLLRPPGSFVFGRAAAGFAVAASPAACRRALDAASTAVHVTGVPVGEPEVSRR
jgi:biotin carboxylase